MSTILARGSTLSLPAAAGAFTIPTPPTATSPAVELLAPNWTAGPTGKDPYRPLSHAIVENLPFFANGYDQPWFWDGGSNYFDMGSTLPATGAAAEDAAGTTFPVGTELNYYLAWRDSTRGRETAPKTLATVTIAAANADVDITWTDPSLGEFDTARIYRRLQSSGLYVFLADVTISDGTYTDATAVGTIETNTPIVERKRETKPPKFIGLASHLNRLWGWTGLDSNLYYGQVSRTDGENVVDDFPSGNVIQIGPHDGDVIVAVVVQYGKLYVWKRRAMYVIAGDSAGTFKSDKVFGDRGCLSAHATTQAEGWYYFLDENGLYFTDLRGEPYIAGAPDGTKYSPLLPLWRRINRDAARHARLFFQEERRLLWVVACLDHDATPLPIAVYDVSEHRFLAEDDGVPVFAAGRLEDAAGVEHDVIGDELLNLWQLSVGNADGAYAGTTTATLTGTGTRQAQTASAATFDTTIDGAPGTPMDRYNSAGDVVDENRVYGATADTLTPLYWSPTAPVIGDSVAVGVIRGLFQIVKTAFNTAEKKHVKRLVIETDVESGGTIRIDSAMDESAFANKREFSLSGEKGRHVVQIHDRGWRWHMRGVQRYAGDDVAIQSIEIFVRAREDRT